MRRLRVAVVGAGYLGRIHARLLKGIERVELVGVVDPAEGPRRHVATECETRAFADHRELAGFIDAAVIAAPTRLHRSIAVDLAQRGTHLLVEKPLAPSVDEAGEIVEAARKAGVVLQVGHVERFNPAWSAVLPHVRDPKFIQADRHGPFSFRSTDIGVVLDLMIHDIDLLLSLVPSPVRRVEALGIAILGRHEDAAHARVEFENGCVAVLAASRVSPAPRRQMQLWSQRRFARLDFVERTAALMSPSDSLLARRVDVESLTPEERQELRERLFAEHLPIEPLAVEPRDALTAELLDFVESVEQGRRPRVDGEQARDAIALAEWILSRIETHSWDGSSAGPTGPLAIPTTRIIPAPHWRRSERLVPHERKQAG